MTIKEYKLKFIELFEQMEEEHGKTDNVEICHSGILKDEFGFNVDDVCCSIKF